MRKIILGLAALVGAFLGTGATAAEGAPAGVPRPVVYGERAMVPKASAAPRLRLAAAREQVALPPVADREVARVRNANARAAARQMQRVVIGVERDSAREARLPRAAQLTWSAVDGGHAARAALTSPDAGSLRVALELAGVPGDVEMVFFGSGDPARLEGPIRVGDIPDRTQPWWSPVTEGETQSIEIFVPARHDPRTLPLALAGAAHIFTTPSSGFTKRLQEIGRAGSCNVDVPCSPLAGSQAFRDVAASVAQMVYNDGGLTGLCTGTLLNDSDPATQVPWFYSANHCFENDAAPYKTPAQMQAVANTLTTLWGFEASACRSTAPDSAWRQMNAGATLVHNDVARDVLFLRLNSQPPSGAFFSGWDPNRLSGGTTVLTVHHPQGDLKKVSEGTVLDLSVPGVAGARESYIEVRWSSGTTEPGSSGSGLWSSSGGQYLFRGGLWGGDALCSNTGGTDHFSRLDQVYASLAPYLAASSRGAIDYTDLWWNPGESGWGLNLIHHAASGVIFGVWYTYEPDGSRTWFVMPSGSWTNDQSFTGPLYATAGPAYGGPFDPNRVRRTQVGSMTITFSDADNGQVSYSVNGVTGTKRISRQAF